METSNSIDKELESYRVICAKQKEALELAEPSTPMWSAAEKAIHALRGITPATVTDQLKQAQEQIAQLEKTLRTTEDYARAMQRKDEKQQQQLAAKDAEIAHKSACLQSANRWAEETAKALRLEGPAGLPHNIPGEANVIRIRLEGEIELRRTLEARAEAAEANLAEARHTEEMLRSEARNLHERDEWLIKRAEAAEVKLAELTYKSNQHTCCAVCGKDKHTPLRNDEMGGYVCLTCIDKELEKLQSELKAAKEDSVLIDWMGDEGAEWDRYDQVMSEWYEGRSFRESARAAMVEEKAARNPAPDASAKGAL